ncbi:MAG: hypothetical protein Q8K72_19025, partial [Acidimicrobiales bacterium]|nr:hypothetical protein [Acidimicrobiales bacterium]
MGDHGLRRPPPAEEAGKDGVGRRQQQPQHDDQRQGQAGAGQECDGPAATEGRSQERRRGQPVGGRVEGPDGQVGDRQVEEAPATGQRGPQEQEAGDGHDVQRQQPGARPQRQEESEGQGGTDHARGLESGDPAAGQQAGDHGDDEQCSRHPGHAGTHGQVGEHGGHAGGDEYPDIGGPGHAYAEWPSDRVVDDAHPRAAGSW